MTSFHKFTNPWTDDATVESEVRFVANVEETDEHGHTPGHVHMSFCRRWRSEESKGFQQAFMAASKADAIAIAQALIAEAEKLPDPFPFEDGDIVVFGHDTAVLAESAADYIRIYREDGPHGPGFYCIRGELQYGKDNYVAHGDGLYRKVSA